MVDIHTQGKVSDDGILTIKGLPTLAGHIVEVTVRDRAIPEDQPRYPLHGQPLRYERPFDSVAEEDWDTLR